MNEAGLLVELLGIIGKMGGLGIGGILAVFFILPPVLAFLAIRMMVQALRSLEQRIASSDARTEAMVREMATKYDNNVILVESYERLAASLTEMVHRSTVVMTKLVDRIDDMIRRG